MSRIVKNVIKIKDEFFDKKKYNIKEYKTYIFINIFFIYLI